MSRFEKLAWVCILCVMLVGCGSFYRGLTGQLDPVKVERHTELVTHIDTLRSGLEAERENLSLAFDLEREELRSKYDTLIENKDLPAAIEVGKQIDGLVGRVQDKTDELALKYETEIDAVVAEIGEVRSMIDAEGEGWEYKAGGLFGMALSIGLGVALKGRGTALKQVVQGIELLGLSGNKYSGQKGILVGVQNSKTMALVSKIRKNIITEKKAG